jgi:phosphoglycolate phosphatase-like HAD superfamily hydrolase
MGGHDVLSRREHHRGFKHVFLDLDGTVTDPREGIVRSVQHSLNKLGRKPPDDCNFDRFIGPPLANAFRILLDAADEALIEQAIEAYRHCRAAQWCCGHRCHLGIRLSRRTRRRRPPMARAQPR